MSKNQLSETKLLAFFEQVEAGMMSPTEALAELFNAGEKLYGRDVTNKVFVRAVEFVVDCAEGAEYTPGV